MNLNWVDPIGMVGMPYTYRICDTCGKEFKMYQGWTYKGDWMLDPVTGRYRRKVY